MLEVYMKALESQFLPVLLEVLFPILSLLGAWALAELSRFIRNRRLQAEQQDALLRLVETVQTVVASVMQTLVPEIRAAAEDGKIDAAEAAKLKKIALDLIKAQLASADLSVLQKAYGPNLDAMIETRIEATLHAVKGSPALVLDHLLNVVDSVQSQRMTAPFRDEMPTKH